MNQRLTRSHRQALFTTSSDQIPRFSDAFPQSSGVTFPRELSNPFRSLARVQSRGNGGPQRFVEEQGEARGADSDNQVGDMQGDGDVNSGAQVVEHDAAATMNRVEVAGGPWFDHIQSAKQRESCD